MCTYNGEPFISKQLESIASQTVLPDEVVICDDGSTDDTIMLVERFSSHVGFEVRLYENPTNLGFIGNFSKAMSLCSGDTIFLADQDDVWLDRKIEVYLNRLKNPEIQALIPRTHKFLWDIKPVKDTEQLEMYAIKIPRDALPI